MNNFLPTTCNLEVAGSDEQRKAEKNQTRRPQWVDIQESQSIGRGCDVKKSLQELTKSYDLQRIESGRLLLDSQGRPPDS